MVGYHVIAHPPSLRLPRCQRGDYPECALKPSWTPHDQSSSDAVAKMSYGKKDEDADLGLVKVDRTQVFQEGEMRAIPLLQIWRWHRLLPL